MQKNLFKEKLFERSSLNLQLRIISSIIIVSVFVTAIFFAKPLFFVLMIAIAAGMLTEWYNITHTKNHCCIYPISIITVGYYLLSLLLSG